LTLGVYATLAINASVSHSNVYCSNHAAKKQRLAADDAAGGAL
jgi:hypothetical protein